MGTVDAVGAVGAVEAVEAMFGLDPEAVLPDAPAASYAYAHRAPAAALPCAAGLAAVPPATVLPAAPVAEVVSEDLGEALGEQSEVEKGELYFPKDIRLCRPPGDNVPATASPLAAEGGTIADALSFSLVVVADLGERSSEGSGVESGETCRRKDILRGLALTTDTEPCKRDVKPMRPPARSVSLISGVDVWARNHGGVYCCSGGGRRGQKDKGTSSEPRVSNLIPIMFSINPEAEEEVCGDVEKGVWRSTEGCRST